MQAHVATKLQIPGCFSAEDASKACSGPETARGWMRAGRRREECP
jgi:hypothetical protein